MPVDIFIDVQNKILVRSRTDPTPVNAPVLVRGDTQRLRIYLLTPTGSSETPFDVYTPPDGAVFAFGMKPKTNFAGTSYLAYNDDFSDISDGIQCTLALNTAGIVSLLGDTTESKEVFSELQMTLTDLTVETIHQWPHTIKNEVVRPETGAPVVADPDYLTAAETTALVRGGNSSTQQFGKVALSAGAGGDAIVILWTEEQESADIHFEALYVQNISGDANKQNLFATVVALDENGCTIQISGEPNSANYYLVYKTNIDPS